MPLNLLARSLALVFALSAVGCGAARQIAHDDTGGAILLQGQRAEAMKEARQIMVEHCRGPYQIVEELEQSEDRWRIRYRCGATRANPD